MISATDQGSHEHARAMKGVVYGFASFAIFAFSDASVKLIRGELPPYESAFFGAVFGLMVLPFQLSRGDRWSDVFVTSSWRLWVLRFLAFPVGVIGSVTAFTHLSMAEAFVLIFLLPAFVTILSVIFLKEQVRFRRWSAVAIGFIGVLIVLRPGVRPLTIGHLGAICAGLSGAISVVAFRLAGPKEKHVSLLGAGTLGGVIVCGLFSVAHFVVPTLHVWLELASYGLLAGIANVLMMRAALAAPATLIGPTQYSQMLWAILLGYVIFGDKVDAPMIVGMILIIGSGLLTLMREKARGTPLPPSVAGERQVAASLSPTGRPS